MSEVDKQTNSQEEKILRRRGRNYIYEIPYARCKNKGMMRAVRVKTKKIKVESQKCMQKQEHLLESIINLRCANYVVRSRILIHFFSHPFD